MSGAKESYPECKYTKREVPDIMVSQEVAEHIGRDYRTLPVFEKGLFEHAYTKHYSLQTNEYLKCRWKEYKKHIEDRVFAPFQFLDIRDYHFYICRNRLIPSESMHTKTDFRRLLKPGPGVDFRGQMPIPQEHHMKRGVGNPRKLPKRYNKEGKEVKEGEETGKEGEKTGKEGEKTGKGK